MKKFISIPGFKGGVAGSLFDPVAKQTYQKAQDLDVFSSTNLLSPYKQSMSDFPIPTGTDVKPKNCIQGSDGQYYFLGEETVSSTARLTLWTVDDITATPTYTRKFTTTTSSRPGALEEFKDYLYFGYGTTLKKYGTMSATDTEFTVSIASPAVFTLTGHGLAAGDTVIFRTNGALPTGLTSDTVYYVISAGLTSDAFEVSTTLAGSAVNTSGSQSGNHYISYASKTVTSSLAALVSLRVHQGLSKIFINQGNIIGWYDGTTLALTALTLDPNETVVDMRPYGRFLVVGLRSTNGITRSRFAIWDGSATTIDDSIDLGDMDLRAFDVVGSNIRALCVMSGYSTQEGEVRFYNFPVNGRPVVNNSLKFTSINGGVGASLETFMGLTIFGLGYTTVGLIPNILWAFGTQRIGEPEVLTQYRRQSSGILSNMGVVNIRSTFGTYPKIFLFKTNSDGVYSIDVSNYNSGTLSNTTPYGIYESNSIPINGGLKGVVRKIYLNHKPLPASTGFRVQIRQYGTEPWGSTIPANPTVTMTAASPTVITKNSHGYVAGDIVRFTTTGAMYTGVTPYTTYYVLATDLSTNTFKISTSAGGTAVNTSGFQSGTHSIDEFVDLPTPQGSGVIAGKTQSTNDSVFTEISSPLFTECRYFQLRIMFDEVTGNVAPEILFPIIIETEPTENL